MTREIRVWAPRANTVVLVVGDAEYPMTAQDQGWWTAAVTPGDGVPPAGSADEIDYGFRVDDNPFVRPDPRSRRQPDGVDGLRRTFDPST